MPTHRTHMQERETLALLIRLDTNQQARERLTITDPQLDPVAKALVDKLTSETEIKSAEDTGYETGLEDGHRQGYDEGYESGMLKGEELCNKSREEQYEEGYKEGYKDGSHHR